MKKYITILTILLIFCSLGSNALARTLSRNETVYVTLNTQGKAEKIEVVTWLRTDNQGLSQDATVLKDVKNIRGTDTPTLSTNDKLIFAAPAKDIFYSGTTTKNLPVTVDIKYRLNGKTVKRSLLLLAIRLTMQIRKMKMRIIKTGSILLSINESRKPS